MIAAHELSKATREGNVNSTFSFKGILKTITPFLGLIILFLIFAVSTDGKFLTVTNLRTIAVQSFITMVAGIGATFTLAHGNLDFSLGGELAICGIVGYFASTVSPWLALPATIITGVLCSSLIAVIHIYMRVPAFIAGLSIMFVGRGLAASVNSITTMISPVSFIKYDNITFYLPVVLGLLIVAFIIFEYTKIGKFNKAIGSNQRAAELSGIPVNKYKIIAFIITGTTLGIAAFMTMIRAGGVGSTTGTGLEVEVLIAMVLGGMSISGGSSSKIRSIIIGALIFMMMGNGLVLWKVNPNWVNTIRGIIFLAMVFLTFDRSRGQTAT